MQIYIVKQNKLSFAIVTVLIAVSMLLTACGPSTNPDGSINVDVTLTDFAIDSSVVTFEPGKTYRFNITNEGAVAHEFVIAEPLAEGMEHSEMEMMHEGLVIEVEEDELPPGASVTADATFPDQVDEPLEMGCHIEGHYEAGMRLPITVK